MSLGGVGGTPWVSSDANEPPKLIEEALFYPPQSKDLPPTAKRCGEGTAMAAKAGEVVKAQMAIFMGGKTPPDEVITKLAQVVGKMLQVWPK